LLQKKLAKQLLQLSGTRKRIGKDEGKKMRGVQAKRRISAKAPPKVKKKLVKGHLLEKNPCDVGQTRQEKRQRWGVWGQKKKSFKVEQGGWRGRPSNVGEQNSP